MQVERKDAGDITVFLLNGSFDTNTSPAVEKQLSTAFDAGATKCIVNFEHVDYVSSAGLRVLLASVKRLRGAGGDLRISNLNPTAQEVFDISGFSTIFKVFETESAATDNF